MLVDFVVQPYFKRIFILSEVHKQSDISTILASLVRIVTGVRTKSWTKFYSSPRLLIATNQVTFRAALTLSS